MIIDIKRAYFYAPAQQAIYVKLPQEDPKSQDPTLCGRLRQSLYGTRDAGANWHIAYTKFLQSIGYTQGTANPCHFISKDRQVKGVVHGDDFMFSGTHADLIKLRRSFEKEYDCKVEIIGNEPNMQKSARFLNRVVTFTPTGIEPEVDQ